MSLADVLQKANEDALTRALVRNFVYSTKPRDAQRAVAATSRKRKERTLLLEFRLISCESAWEEAVAVFMIKWLIPLHRLFYAKLV